MTLVLGSFIIISDQAPYLSIKVLARLEFEKIKTPSSPEKSLSALDLSLGVTIGVNKSPTIFPRVFSGLSLLPI